MRVCGIICEYNPFHNGHAHHLRCAREKSGADYLLCVMSGSFVQRGEPAILDKWTRAESALRCGADLVLELPVIFSVRSAQDFARGAVSHLQASHIVTHLSFGTESDDPGLLERLSLPETQKESAQIREALSKGLSHSAARVCARGFSARPNELLASEYLRALREVGSDMLPVPVLRSTDHRDPNLQELASASAIRLALQEGKDVSCALPVNTSSLVLDSLPAEIPTLDSFSRILLYKLRTAEPKALREDFGITKGLENRLCRESFESQSASELLSRVSCRRYPAARINRLLTRILLNLREEILRAHQGPEYLRVLGFRKSASPLLRALSEKSSVPIVMKAADASRGEMLSLDFAAQDIWDLISAHPAHRDLTEPLRILP